LEKLPKLQILDVAFCAQLNPEALSALLSKTKAIRSVGIFSCWKLDENIEDIKKAFPNILENTSSLKS